MKNKFFKIILQSIATLTLAHRDYVNTLNVYTSNFSTATNNLRSKTLEKNHRQIHQVRSKDPLHHGARRRTNSGSLDSFSQKGEAKMRLDARKRALHLAGAADRVFHFPENTMRGSSSYTCMYTPSIMARDTYSPGYLRVYTYLCRLHSRLHICVRRSIEAD